MGTSRSRRARKTRFIFILIFNLYWIKKFICIAVTTSKWDFFDEYHSDKNSNDDSIDGKELQEIEDNKNSNIEKNNEISQQQQPESLSTETLLTELNEEKRQILREIVVQAVKYQDDLESGRIERNSNMTVHQQIENHRNYLLKKVKFYF